MGKTNPKKFAQLCRKLVVLSDLTIDVVDEIGQYNHNEPQFKQDLNAVRDKCIATIEAAYSVDSVMSSTYITQLSNQIDTMIRQNFHIQDI